MIWPPIQLYKPKSVDLENTTLRSPVKDKIVLPATPSLPIMPSFRELFHPRLNQQIHHIFYPKGNKILIENLLLDPIMARVWQPVLESELGTLSQGFNNRVKAQDAMEFIAYSDIPKDRNLRYANFICDYCPLKTEQFRARMTIGGDRLEYPDETSSPTASLVETKLLINSVISDHKLQNAKFCSIDIKDFFLATPMVKAEYLRTHKRYFSPEFTNTYKLHDKMHNGYIYCKVKKVCTDSNKRRF